MRERARDQSAQRVLREPGGGGVYRREGCGQAARSRAARGSGGAPSRRRLCPRRSSPNTRRRTPRSELLQLARIEVEEHQIEVLRALARAAHQHALGPVLHFAGKHRDLDLHGVARTGLAQWRELGLVLVAQRQMQRPDRAGASGRACRAACVWCRASRQPTGALPRLRSCCTARRRPLRSFKPLS